MGERSPARETQGTSFLSEPHLAQASGFVILPNPRVTEGRRRQRSQIRDGKKTRIQSKKGRRPRSALPLLTLPRQEPLQSLSKAFPKPELMYFVGREGRGRGGGRAALQQSADEWSLCARCCSAVTTSTFSGGRKRASSAPPHPPDPGCLLSGPPARTGPRETAPDLGHLARPKRLAPGADTARDGRVCPGVAGSRGK